MIDASFFGGAIDLRLRPPCEEFRGLHFFSDREGLFERLRQRGYSVPKSLAELSIGSFWEEMSEAGIAGGLICARSPGRLGGVSNADVAEVVKRYPERLVGFAGCVSLDEEGIGADLEECKRLGAVAVSLEPGLAEPPMYADDKKLMPIYAAISESHLPVFVTGGDSGPDITYASPVALERVGGWFPSLEIVAAHGGWPWVREMIAVARHRKNVWVMPDMYSTKFVGHSDYTEVANGMLRDQMLFGSNYPAVNIKEHVSALLEDGLREDAWHALAVENPRRLLGVRA